MHAAKAICCQGSHLLGKMAPPKSFQKVGLSPEDSFLLVKMAPPKSFQKVGLYLKGSFALHAGDGAVQLSSGHVCRIVLRSASADMLSNGMGCPKLGKVGCICPSSATANPVVVSQKSSTKNPFLGPFARHSLEHPSSALATSTPSHGTSSRHIHCGADREGDRSDKEDSRSQKLSSKVTKKGLPGRQAAKFSTMERSSSASEDRIYFLGRLLTSILRHRATDLKLQVRNDGYVVVNDLLKLALKTRAGIPLSVYTVEDVLKAVERDNKQRFSVLTENGVLLIRASQGHSIKTIESDKLLKPILSSDEIPVCIHGTLLGNLGSILKTGLKKMGRNHVHFASGLPREGGVISGMRHTSEVLIYLDSKKALQDGMKLYMSDNGVILTEGFDGVVPPEYFAKIVKWKNGKLIPLPLKARHESV